MDAQTGYRDRKNWLVALDIFNIPDVKWNDIESRLKNAGVPRTLRARFQYQF